MIFFSHDHLGRPWLDTMKSNRRNSKLKQRSSDIESMIFQFHFSHDAQKRIIADHHPRFSKKSTLEEKLHAPL
jgi:hypothetical protein